MRFVLALAVACALAGCGHTGGSRADDNAANADTQTKAAPYTDASMPPSKDPAGAPQRALTDLPSTELAAVKPGARPAEAFIEQGTHGVELRIVSQNVPPGESMPAELSTGACSTPGTKLRDLQPVKGGASFSNLPGMTPQQLSGDTVRVYEKGSMINCGTFGAKLQMQTR